MADDSTTAAAKPTAIGGRWGLIIFALAVFAFSGIRTIASADIWTHIAAGRDAVHNGIPRHPTLTFALPAEMHYVDSTWLYDIAVAGIWKVGGVTLLTLSHIAAAVLAVFIVSFTALRRGAIESWSVALAIAMATWILLPSFIPQPVLVAVVFVAVFLAALNGGTFWPRARFVLPVLQILWTNLHSSFVLGPVIAGLFAADAFIEERRGNKPAIPFAALAVLTVVLALLTFLNPYGYHLHTWVGHVWLDPMRSTSLDGASLFAGEFAPTMLSYNLYVVLALLAGGLVAIRQRLSVALAGAAILGAFLLVRSPASAALSVVMIVPFLAMSLMALAPLVSSRSARDGGAVAVVSLVLLAGLIASGKHLQHYGLASRNGIGVETDAYPEAAAAAAISKPAFPWRTLNLAADGGYLAAQLPTRDVFCDSRASLYGGLIYEVLVRALLGDDKAMQALANAYAPSAIVLNSSWPLAGNTARALTAQGAWALAYFDGTTAIFMRNTLQNMQFTRNRSLQQEGLKTLEAARKAYADEIRHASGNHNSTRLTGAGHIFLGLEKFAEAEVVYRLLTEGTPTMYGAWLGLGIAQEQQGRHADALATLQRATSLRKKDPLPLLWLSVAQRATSQNTEADASVEKARALNPQLTDTFLKNPPHAAKN